MRCRLILIITCLICLLSADAEAQRMAQHGRATVDSPQVLARGGAAAALPSHSSALFYNPAHLARIESSRIEVLSVQGAISTNLAGNLRFLLKDVIPAIEDGLGTPLSASTRALFEEALERGRAPTVGQAAIALPTVLISAGTIGFGGSAFATNTSRLRFEDIGAGIPLMDLFSQVDAGFAGGVATEIPGTGLAVGATTRYARRYLTSKSRDLLSMSSDSEQLYIVTAQAAAIDLGVHLQDVLPSIPGQLDLGGVVYDIIGGRFDYQLHRAIALTGDGPIDQAEVDRIIAGFGARGGPSTRIGVAYRPQMSGSIFSSAIALDWVSASTSEADQPAAAGLRLGAEASLTNRFTVRGGVGQGYPSVGFHLALPGVHVDYALFGVEEGRLPGQLGRYNHLLQLRIGIF